MIRFACVLFLLSLSALAQKPVLVGYLPQWGLYGTPPWSARDLLTSGSAALLDQINYSQAFAVNGRCAVADPNADIAHVYTAESSVDGTADNPATPLKGEFHQLQELHAKYPHLRLLISLEGKPAAFADAAQPPKRAAFVSSCIDMFLRGNLAPGVSAPGLFTGIDVDWEYPNASPADGANYTALAVEFRKQLDAYGLAAHTRPMLTFAAAPGMARYPGVDWPVVGRAVDLLGLMNYDYNGPWQDLTGIVAPLYPIPGVVRESGTVDSTVAEYVAAGVPKNKLLLGVPFYGYQWTDVADAGAQHGLGMPGTPDHGDLLYREIAAMPGPRFRDPHSQAPWLYDGDSFRTYDDPQSSEAKAVYARTEGLAGVMIWELSGDTPNGALVKALRHGLNSINAAR